MLRSGTTDGYWTILETVPYSIQNTNTATTISNVVSGSQQHLSDHRTHLQHIQEQQLHQQHVSTSTDPTNLITSATVVVEIPSESMGGLPGSTIQYTIPKTESHQLLRTATVTSNINKIHHNQRIQHLTQQRLISNAPSQTTTPSIQPQSQQQQTQQQQQQHQQHETHHQHMQQLALQDCLDTNLVTHELQHQSQQQQTTQTHPEYIKINANRLEEKVLLRNVVQYETTGTNVGDTIVIENPKINLHQQNSQQQQQHRHQQHHHQQQDSNIEEHILLTEHVVNEVVTNESDIKEISADTELGVEIEKALFRQRPKLATSRSTTIDTTPVDMIDEKEFIINEVLEVDSSVLLLPTEDTKPISKSTNRNRCKTCHSKTQKVRNNCIKCSKTFKSKHLQKHKKSKRTSALYHCFICDKTLARKFCLKRHMKSVHKEISWNSIPIDQL
ncbi:bromodomain-containing protein DDB_G0280777-like [Teleopsis dalmanni]|uniref:bromodomain-containing protein DDB_G0280777-like n=1 Tax=Teleopsis dalmanni TaxID=139649 RepID=UPI0018CD7AF6|nr:bromodomain-containing protein DDB_G0280777-like [Teleopsis dalmanni]